MKVFYMLLIFLPLAGFSQTLTHKEKKIAVGAKVVIHSDILEEDRELWVYVPSAYMAASQNRYPVMYLLDGPSFFNPIAGMVQYLSATGKMPEMIVIAISNTNRIRDLTPTHTVYWSDGEKDTSVLGISGGGKKFISFIEHELIPYIDSVYTTAPYRMFVGHSLGGITVLNALLHHPHLFTSYVAIDPSVWWDKGLMMNNALHRLMNADYSGKSLYYASANTMNKGMDTIRVLQDSAHGNIHVRNNLQFRSILQNSTQSQLKWNWKFYPEDNHATVPLIAGYDALRYLFKGYEIDKDVNDTSINVTDINAHFHKISALFHYEVLPSESLVNALGYHFLSNKLYHKAYAFFTLNLKNYPSSANAYDSMGDFFMETNERKKAREMFTKALSFNELPATRKKLEQLNLIR